MKYLLICAAWLILPFHAQAQSVAVGWETYYAQLMALDGESLEAEEDTYEQLAELHAHPIDLNTATRDDLERIPFLSETQVEELAAYIGQSRGMRTVAELSLIESLDATRRALLPYFITLSNEEPARRFPPFKTLLRKGTHTLTAQANVPFYDRRGDQAGYLGPKYRHGLRYTFQYGKYLQAGLTGAQDAGEPFFCGRNRWGYDHYSFYVTLRDVSRHLKTVAVGRYRVRTGLGLAVNNDVSFGKQMATAGLFRTGSVVKPHASRSAWNYLQGGAATVALSEEVAVSAFFSWRKIDATLTSDGEGIATLLQSGYHRTEREMQKKDNAAQTTAGGHVAWRRGGFHMGATGVWTRFDKPLKPNTAQGYRRYYPAGETHWNASVDYGYTNGRLTVSGETATGGCHAVATLNAVAFRPIPTLTVTAIQRFYGYKYYTLTGQSLAEGGRVQNESGVMAGLDWSVGDAWTLTAYTDYAYFPWEKYQAHTSSHSWDNFLQTTYRRGAWLFAARYRLRTRTKDDETKTRMIGETTQRARLSATYTAPSWTLRTQADAVRSDYKRRSQGYMLTETATWHGFGRVQLTALAGYFHTDDYASRVYVYERGPVYSFSFPAFYGRGFRYSLFLRADVSKRLMAIAKLGVTDYLDRDHISSGLQQIDRSSKTDLELQVRVKW